MVIDGLLESDTIQTFDSYCALQCVVGRASGIKAYGWTGFTVSALCSHFKTTQLLIFLHSGPRF